MQKLPNELLRESFAHDESYPKKNEDPMENNNSKIIIYQTEDGVTKISARFDNNSVWLTQSDFDNE